MNPDHSVGAGQGGEEEDAFHGGILDRNKGIDKPL